MDFLVQKVWKSFQKSQPQKSVRKNRQLSQIPGAQNAVGRAGAGMEVVGALPGVPSDSVKMWHFGLDAQQVQILCRRAPEPIVYSLRAPGTSMRRSPPSLIEHKHMIEGCTFNLLDWGAEEETYYVGPRATCDLIVGIGPPGARFFHTGVRRRK